MSSGLPWWLSHKESTCQCRVWSLIQEDPTCGTATKPAHLCSTAFQPQLLKLRPLEPVLGNKRSHRSEKPRQQQRPSVAQNELINSKKYLVRVSVKYLLRKAMRTIKVLPTFIIRIVDNLSLYFVWIIHYKENPYFPAYTVADIRAFLAAHFPTSKYSLREECYEIFSPNWVTNRTFIFLIMYLHMYVFIFWPLLAACGILVPQPGVEPAPPVVEVQSLNHWTAGEVH